MKARQYFAPSNMVATKVINMLQPFVIEFKPFIDDMTQMEKRVRKCADIATMDRIKRNSVQLEQNAQPPQANRVIK
ncbi:hypothetical protein BGX38DRAFT_1279005 [Terfezia claveryi]|nr:hypothetical protein BGX38DRAFT_1279005 [Terfezia claveryi]